MNLEDFIIVGFILSFMLSIGMYIKFREDRFDIYLITVCGFACICGWIFVILMVAIGLIYLMVCIYDLIIDTISNINKK